MPSGLKLMVDRLVCADGGNPDPTTTHGKQPEEAKKLELKGWDYPRHLAGRVFGVAVHGDAAGAEVVMRVERGEGDVVEVAKAHRGIGRGVMAGGAHEGESRGAGGEGVFGRGDRGGSGATGVVGDVGEIGRVGVEVAGLSETAQVRGGVGAKERGVGEGSGGRRDAEFPRGVSGAEMGGGTGDAGGLLGAHRGAVVGALGIVKNEHGRNGHENHEESQKPSYGNATQ